MGTAFRRHHAPLEKTGSQRFVPANAINAPPRTSSYAGPIPRDRRPSRARSRRRPAGLDAAHVGFVFTEVHQGCQYGNGDFGTSISCDPRGLGTQGTTADRKMNAAVRFDCLAWSGRDRCGGRPLLTTQSESWRLHRVAHRPGPGRSEQVRRSGPGPDFQFEPPASAKKYDGRSRETDRAIKTGTSAAKSYRFDASFYLVGCLRMQLRQHNHRNKDNQRGRQ